MLAVLLVYVLLFQWSSEASLKDPEFIEHMQRVRTFRCKHPRPTALKIFELTEEGLLGKTFVPDVTVLHRCDDGAGCCFGSRLVCGPVDTELVQLKFFVTDIVTRSQGYEEMEATNHTKCGCVEPVDHPRRVLHGSYSSSSKCDKLSLLQILTVVGVLLWKCSFQNCKF